MNKEYEKIEKKAINAIHKGYKLILQNIKKELVKLEESGHLNADDIVKFGRLKKLEQSVITEANAVTKSGNRTIKNELAEVYEDTYYRTGFTLETQVQAKLGYQKIQDKLLKAALINQYDPIGWETRNKNNNALMVRQIMSKVSEGVVQGRPYREIAKDIEERVGISSRDAMVIARTEGGRVYSRASLDSMMVAESAGVIVAKKWVSTLDERTRPSHQQADGQEATLDGQFEVGGVKMIAPRMSGVASEDLSCRCAMIEIVKGFEPKFRRVRGEGVIPYKTFDEWKQQRIGATATGAKQTASVLKELNKLKQSGMSEGDYNQYLNTINNSSPDIKHLYSKYADDVGSVKETKNGGVYYSKKNELEFSYPTAEGKHKYSVLAHEYGHYFDYKAKYNNISFSEITKVRDITGIDYVFVDRACMSDEFLASVRKDKEHIKSIITSEKKADLYNNHASSGVQDAIDGLFPKSRIFWGHGEKYYNKYYAEIEYRDKTRGTAVKKTLQQAYKDMGFDAKTLTKTKEIVREYRASSEIWANVMSAEVTGGKSLDYAKEYLPNSYKAMIEIIKGAE